MAQKYDAPRRRAQSAATRERVLRSAQRLFTLHGYARTSVARVAFDAKVSDRLVYNLFDSKRGLLLALLEHFAPTPFEVFEEKIADAGNPAAELAVAADFIVEYYTSAKDLLAITIPAAGTDVDLHAFVEQGERFRRLSQRALVERWEEIDALRPELTASRAGDVLWAMTSPEIYLKLDAAGWTPEFIRTWLIQTLVEVILRPGSDGEQPNTPRSPIGAP